MAISPIDLQTMYSQLENVAKTLSASQQTQLTEAMHQQSNIQRKLEENKKVQETSNEKAKANTINQNVSNSTDFTEQQKRKKPENQEQTDDFINRPLRSDNSNLGTVIDITG